MRSLEMVFIVFNILMLIWVLFAKRKPQSLLLIMTVISVVLLLLHSIIEGMRWPLIPAYLITAVAIIMYVSRLSGSKRREPHTVQKSLTVKRISVTLLFVVYAAIVVALPLLTPVFSFEKPAGPFKIGTVSYDWVDESRDEIYTSDHNDKRELMVQIWYPADITAKGKTQAYRSDIHAFAEGYHKLYGLPKAFFHSIGYVKTHAFERVQLSNVERSYPVLIFSHGLGGNRMQNMFQVEQFVSQGYIVVGIDHTYSSTATIFPDGRVAPLLVQNNMSVAELDKANRQWVADVKFVLDQLEKLAANDPDGRFTGHMDMEHVGMFGHSFGGATSLQVLMTDDRIKAAINMDGALYGELRVPEEGLKKPFLMINSDSTLETLQTSTEQFDYANEVHPRYDHITQGGNYWMILKKTSHASFTDFVLSSPLFHPAQGHNVRETHQLINDYTRDFFDHYLRNKPFQFIEQHIGENPDFTIKKG